MQIPNPMKKFICKMYENLEWFGDTEEKQNRALLAIREGIVNLQWLLTPEPISGYYGRTRNDTW